MLEPRARNVEPGVMMEQLFKLSELETRIPINMNVLVDGVDAARRPLRRGAAAMARPSPRRAAAPLAPSPGRDRAPARTAGRHDHRLPQSRRGDPHHPRGGRAEGGADGALRAHREAGQLHPRHAPALAAPARGNGSCARSTTELHEGEGARSRRCSATRSSNGRRSPTQIRDIKKKYGPETKLGKRRTTFEAPPDVVDRRSRRGDDRARAGDGAGLAKGLDPRAEGPCRRPRRAATFKGDDALQTSFFAETTSKILVLASDGKAFTLDAAKLPGGRGARRADPADGRYRRGRRHRRRSGPTQPGEKMLVAASDGRGFVVGAGRHAVVDAQGQGGARTSTRRPRRASSTPAEGDHVAAIGENRKLLVFPLTQVPEMARGKGVRLQRYKDGGLSDARVFALEGRHDLARSRPAAPSRSPRPTSRTGSATAPKPAACRPRASPRQPVRRLRPPSERRRAVLPFGAGAGICP